MHPSVQLNHLQTVSSELFSPTSFSPSIRRLDVLHRNRKRELHFASPLLRRSRFRATGDPDSRISPEQRVMGKTSSRASRCRVSRNRVRPARVWKIQPTHRRLQLRNVRRGPAQSHHQPQIEGFRSGRVLDGRRRSRALHRKVRVQRCLQSGDHRRSPALPAQDQGQSRRCRCKRVRRNPEGCCRGPVCLLHGVFQKLLQHRRPNGKARQRASRTSQLERCVYLVGDGQRCVRADMA